MVTTVTPVTRSVLTMSRNIHGDDAPAPAVPITGRDAATILGLGYPGALNNARRRLQRAVPVKGTALVIWVVDAWGGVKWPGAEWRYDAEKCRRAARGEL